MSASCGDDWETSSKSRVHLQDSLRKVMPEAQKTTQGAKDEIELAEEMDHVLLEGA